MKRLLPLAALAVLLPCPSIAEDVPEIWRTVAEKTDFRATSTFAQTMDFLKRVESRAPDVIRVTFFGESAEGRRLPLVVVSSEGAFTPDAAKATGKPILLLQSGIHAGEIDGKDASLMLLREIALGRRPDLAEAAVTLFVPIYNLDGHERISPFNRPNQNGPTEGMGFRATTSGLNLNRDCLRLASPEARALARLVADWRPHLHVDNHVTNGTDHAWVLTWMVAEAPLLDPEVDAWVSRHLPAVLEATREAGHPNGPYVSLYDRDEPAKGMSWAGIQWPRYSTGYFPLINRPSILIEMHAHKPYRDRVLANRDFMDALILETGRAGSDLIAAVTAAERRTVALGAADADPSAAVVSWGEADEVDSVIWPAFEYTKEDSLVTGGSHVVYERGAIELVDLPWRHRLEPELEVVRPRGYLVHAGWPQIEEVVRAHGLTAVPLPEPVEAEVETIRLSDPAFAASPYQGVMTVADFTVIRGLETRRIPAGSLWIPADQPDFEVAVQLFEPEARDSLLRWGALSSIFEMKTYIGLGKLEEIARTMIADDEVRTAWESALEDPDFAADERARYMWWYRRTPYWDEQVGLLPIYRVLSTDLPATLGRTE
ncbi:MAG: M14 family metallopeptidase [Candidatus Sulfomarinibacteraceae bacterium]